LARRLKAMGNPKYQRDGDPKTSGPGFAVTLHRDQLELPHRWAAPRIIFVNSMSDLFHPDVPEAFIRDVFEVMVDTPRHTYQVLTKRSKRLAQMASRLPWPENVWMGVSVELDKYAFRADHLRSVPAAVRFISAEPLLGSVPSLCLDDIDWLIAGGESGHGARPMHPAWAMELRDRCRDIDTAFFFKQWGSWAPLEGSRSLDIDETGLAVSVADGRITSGTKVSVRRVGRSTAGRTLEGRTWDEMPSSRVMAS
jgi:protein gp37